MVVILINLFSLFSNLDSNKQKRCFKSLNLLEKICEVNPDLSALKGELYVLVLAYSIGHASSINNLGFPPLDGAIYLDSVFNNCHDIACAIARQSNAYKISNNRFDDIYEKYEIDTSTKQLFLEILDLIDSHVSSTGEIASFETRFLDILDEYGRDSLQSQLFRSSIGRLHELEINFKWNNDWIEHW